MSNEQQKPVEGKPVEQQSKEEILAQLKLARDAEKELEANCFIGELDEAQRAAMDALDLFSKRNEIAIAAFAAVLRGKVQSQCDKAIKAKYIAQSKNKAALAEECEKEIQTWIRLKQRLG